MRKPESDIQTTSSFLGTARHTAFDICAAIAAHNGGDVLIVATHQSTANELYHRLAFVPDINMLVMSDDSTRTAVRTIIWLDPHRARLNHMVGMFADRLLLNGVLCVLSPGIGAYFVPTHRPDPRLALCLEIDYALMRAGLRLHQAYGVQGLIKIVFGALAAQCMRMHRPDLADYLYRNLQTKLIFRGWFTPSLVTIRTASKELQ